MVSDEMSLVRLHLLGYMLVLTLEAIMGNGKDDLLCGVIETAILNLTRTQDGDAVNVEAFINKASFLVSSSQHEVLNLQYKVCDARILDLKRSFLEAALRYYNISQIEKRQIEDEEIDEEALEQALAAAVTCTILAVAGPQRSRVLSTLYKACATQFATKAARGQWHNKEIMDYEQVLSSNLVQWSAKN